MSTNDPRAQIPGSIVFGPGAPGDYVPKPLFRDTLLGTELKFEPVRSMTNDESTRADTLEILNHLEADIADGKVVVIGYDINRDYGRFTYTIRVERREQK